MMMMMMIVVVYCRNWTSLILMINDLSNPNPCPLSAPSPNLGGGVSVDGLLLMQLPRNPTPGSADGLSAD